MAPIGWLAGYFVSVSALTFLLFGWDKVQAKREARRVPEALLLQLALCGGWPGAKLGQRLFRHKTRKHPFASRLSRLAVVNAILALVLSVWLIA